jgi:hypothetical protein
VAYFAARQVELLRVANESEAMLRMFAEFRKKEFYENYKYVQYRLNEMNDPDQGVYGLDEKARAALLDVGHFYQELVYRALFDLMSAELAMSVLHSRVTNVWDSIAPFVHTERAKDPENERHNFKILETGARVLREMSDDAMVDVVEKQLRKQFSKVGLTRSASKQRMIFVL